MAVFTGFAMLAMLLAIFLSVSGVEMKAPTSEYVVSAITYGFNTVAIGICAYLCRELEKELR